MRKIRSVKLQILSIHILINFKFFFIVHKQKKEETEVSPFVYLRIYISKILI